MTVMSRKHKKRNKPYTGEEAVPDRPVIHHYTAVVRSPLGEWWHDHKRTVRIGAIIAGVTLVVSLVIYTIVDFFV